VPETTLDTRYSEAHATATPWEDAREALAAAEIYWLSTVRPDGRPHCTPLIAVWVDEALYFTTGADERKARNLEQNRSVVVTTGVNTMARGLDIVVEGDALHVSDMDVLQRVAEAFPRKYGDEWRFTAEDGHFRHPRETGFAEVFEVRPKVAFGFGKGEDTFSQTRWRF
jgi:hypothetical protein